MCLRFGGVDSDNGFIDKPGRQQHDNNTLISIVYLWFT